MNDDVDGGAVPRTVEVDPDPLWMVDESSVVSWCQLQNFDMSRPPSRSTPERVVARGWTPRLNLLQMQEALENEVLRCSAGFRVVNWQEITIRGSHGTGTNGWGYYWQITAALRDSAAGATFQRGSVYRHP